MEDTEEIVEREVAAWLEEHKDEEEQEQAATENEHAATEEEEKKRKAIVPRSDVWGSFSKVKISNGEERAKCKYCQKLFRCDPRTNGTSSLKNHLKICKKNPNKPVIDNQRTLQITPGSGGSSVGTCSTWKFDIEDLRNSFAEMIIEDEQPFVLSERPGLRKFLAKACPRFTLPSRRTTTRACVKVYDVQRLKLKKFLKENCERVSLTTDTWTANTNQNYMCVTAHFIDNDWKLHKKIIGFFLVKGHRGEDIGKSLDNCLSEWRIDKVLSITVDNASANNNAIKYMKRVLNESKGCIAEGEFLHMRCVAHIINLIVADGLKEINKSICRVRAAIKFVKAGPARLAKFKKCAELAKVQTKAFLTLDVCTMWNSTYHMLNIAQQYEKAFERYSDEDPYYKLDLEGHDGPGVPEKSDWDKARKMAEFLEHFYELTLRVSATSRPTSHTFFHEIAGVVVLLRQWCNSEDLLCAEMGKRMLLKYQKYWGEIGPGVQNLNLIVFFCVALDPRYKLNSYIKMATMVMFGDEIGEQLWTTVVNSFHSLFHEYKEIYTPNEPVAAPNDIQGSLSTSKRLMRSIVAQQMSNNGASRSIAKSELDKYFSEDNEEDTKGFDILKYWKDNSTRLPLLSRMARDLLAIPISSVASESAFSAGGRTLDDFRSSLTPTMVERLICANDWLRGCNSISVEENAKDLSKLEEGETF